MNAWNKNGRFFPMKEASLMKDSNIEKYFSHISMEGFHKISPFSFLIDIDCGPESTQPTYQRTGDLSVEEPRLEYSQRIDPFHPINFIVPTNSLTNTMPYEQRKNRKNHTGNVSIKRNKWRELWSFRRLNSAKVSRQWQTCLYYSKLETSVSIWPAARGLMT